MEHYWDLAWPATGRAGAKDDRLLFRIASQDTHPKSPLPSQHRAPEVLDIEAGPSGAFTTLDAKIEDLQRLFAEQQLEYLRLAVNVLEHLPVVNGRSSAQDGPSASQEQIDPEASAAGHSSRG